MISELSYPLIFTLLPLGHHKLKLCFTSIYWFLAKNPRPPSTHLVMPEKDQGASPLVLFLDVNGDINLVVVVPCF